MRRAGTLPGRAAVAAALAALLALGGCAKEVVPIPERPARAAPPAVARPAPAPQAPAPAAPPPAPAVAPAPLAEAPVFHPGEEWRWTGGGVTRVVGVEGGLHVTEDGEGRRRTYDPTWTLVKAVNKAGVVVADPQVGRRVLAFPLGVGKEWTWRGTFPGVGGQPPRPYVDRYRVTGYERVQVPAGSFMAFVIEHVQEVPAQGGAPAAEARRTLWYSPDVKVFIKVASPTPGWGGGELEAYRPR